MAMERASNRRGTRGRHRQKISDLELMIELLEENGTTPEELVEEQKMLISLLRTGGQADNPDNSVGHPVATSENLGVGACAGLRQSYVGTPPQSRNPSSSHSTSANHSDPGSRIGSRNSLL